MARELNERQQKFLEVLFEDAGGDVVAAKKLAGYSDTTSTTAIVKGLKEEILEATQMYMARNAPKAAMAVTGALYDPTELGIRDKMAAAKELLDRTGLIKTEKVQVEAAGGVMLMPPKAVSKDDQKKFYIYIWNIRFCYYHNYNYEYTIMTDKKVTRRSFLKGLGATAAVAATGVPTGAGKKTDPLKTMLNQLKKLNKDSGAKFALFREVKRMQREPTRLNKNLAQKVVNNFLKDKKITQNFANKIVALLNGTTEERKKFISAFDSEEDKRFKKANEIREKAIKYTQKKNLPVVVNLDGTLRQLNQKKGEQVVYKRIPGNKQGAVMPSITSESYRKKQEKDKKKPPIRLRGAGSAAGENGVHKIFEGPQLIKIQKDYRKGGMILSTVDNRKNK